MPSNQQYLTPADLAMIEEVLAEAGFEKSESSLARTGDAAQYLIRQFQDGVTGRADLALSLNQYITRHALGPNPHRAPNKLDDEGS